jgi:hypothetical protein
MYVKSQKQSETVENRRYLTKMCAEDQKYLITLENESFVFENM